MSRHKAGYVISYHGILCHDISYVTTIAASLVGTCLYASVCACTCVCVRVYMPVYVYASVCVCMCKCVCACVCMCVCVYVCVRAERLF